jgi:hypothetical protein
MDQGDLPSHMDLDPHCPDPFATASEDPPPIPHPAPGSHPTVEVAGLLLHLSAEEEEEAMAADVAGHAHALTMDGPDPLCVSEQWPGEDYGQDMDVELDVTEARLAGEQPEVAAAARRELLVHGIDVNPTHQCIICVNCMQRIQFNNTYSHFRSKHASRSRITDAFPSRPDLERLLVILKADDPLPPPTTPIPKIPSLCVVDGVRCMVGSCNQVFSEVKRLREHCRLKHPDSTGRHTAYIRVKAHPTSLDLANRRYVEILPAEDPLANNLALSTILNKFKELNIGRPRTTFQRANNARIRTPFVAKTNWDHPFVDVELAKLRLTVAPPDTKLELEPHLVRLKTLIRDYYLLVGEALRELQVSHLTLRHIRSADPK